MEYINREISWLSFNERVLQEAEDTSVPLVERVRFLGIFSNNLDEFFRVRIASLARLADLGKKTKAKLEDDPVEVLAKAGQKVRKLQERRDVIYEKLKEELKKEGTDLINHLQIPSEHEEEVKNFFYESLRPKLVPIMLDQVQLFPELDDASIYLLVKLTLGSEQEKYSLIEIPKILGRFYVIKEAKGSKVLYIDDIIRFKLKKLYRTLEVKSAEAYTIKISRDAELDFDDDFSQSLLEKMEKSVQKRKRGNYVRLLYDREMPEPMLMYLKSSLKIKGRSNIIAGGKYHNKRDLLSFPTSGNKDLVFKPNPVLRHPEFKNEESLFKVIDKGDVLLHMPYQRFDYITAVLREAAIDPYVRSISITLYRVNKNSDIINALINATKNGKRVNVVIELQARFDEENNIFYSDLLKQAGANVILGAPGLKVHSKIILIQRKVDKKSAHIGYVGTGNFHEGNSKIYEDVGVFTENKTITSDLKKLFGLFENPFQQVAFSQLIVSPFATRQNYSALILNEIAHAQRGGKASIRLKMNSLVDKEMINLLYEASKAGVMIKLIVRGICCLKAGVKGLSENIEVKSIVGRYLEHSRILEFQNAVPQVYISSADWMGRNLDRRVEVSLPITDEKIETKLKAYLALQWSDNTKSRVLGGNQLNKYFLSKGEKINAQQKMYDNLKSELN
ncbi:MAG: polyphosphate kinase 1 [Flavobacteriales bacterium]